MKKKISTLILYLLFASLMNAQDIKSISLDGDWLFKTDMYNQGIDENWHKQSFNSHSWETMKVPGNWDLKNEYADYAGKAWYKKDFEISKDLKEKILRLQFESVYNDAQIWINGSPVGQNHLGYLPFEIDISKYINYGEKNQVTVLVDNTFKRGAIWNWGGIRRSVSIKISNKVYIDYQHITAIPNLKEEVASVEVKIAVVNKDTRTRTIDFGSTIFFNQELIVKSNSKKDRIKIEPEKTGYATIKYKIPKTKVNLWHFNHPNLYTSKVNITNVETNTSIDTKLDRFGIRAINVDGIELKLNGKAIRPVGFNLVAEDRTTGNTLPLWRIKEDVDLMKSLGVNMARISHAPLPKQFLDYLDEKGIMTFEEVSLWGKDTMVDPEHNVPKEWLSRMIKDKYNHPSIIGWSVGNEIGGGRNPKVRAYVKTAIQQAKKSDPTRLALYVSDTAPNDKNDAVEFSDLIMLNSYSNWGARVDKTNEVHPNKPIFMSELGKELTSEDLNKGVIDITTMLNEMRHKPHTIGASLWTFNDYRSFWQASPTWSTPPSQNRSWGIVDVFRQQKKSFNIFQKEYAPFIVSELRHSSLTFNPKEKITTHFKLKPRSINDFPVYDMEGYHLIWYVLNKKDDIVSGDFEVLPKMKPGGNEINKEINWKIPDTGGQSLNIKVLDPQNYTVYKTTIFIEKPRIPTIKKIHTGEKGTRVIFEKSALTTSLKAMYGIDELTKETASTINNYIDIPRIGWGVDYKIQLIATNSFGETKSDVIDLKPDKDELPPIIRSTIPSDNSFFIGYSVDKSDYLFDIKYGTKPNQYDKMITLRNVGVCQVPNLENGQTYYYKLRRRVQWGFASEWSHEVKVVPDGGLLPKAPQVKGVIRKGNTAMVIIKPVPKVIGYNIRVEEKNGSEKRDIYFSSAQTQTLSIEKLNSKKQYNFYISAINSYGNSKIKHINEKSN